MQENVTAAENLVRKIYEGKTGVEITGVTLIKESNKKMKGFINLKVIGQAVQLKCIVELDADLKNMLANCEP